MRRVIIMVFDGLQPAQVTPELMPNLTALAALGVTFANHHAVFPTVTRINAASMVTGRYPGGHGLAANTLVVRDFDPYRAFSALEPTLAEVAHKTGRVLLAPTLGDILSEHGQEYIAVGTGTTGNAYVHNPNAHRSGGATIHPEFCLPYNLHDDILGRFGPWPEEATPNTERLSHAVRIMTEYILPERNPTVSLLWSSEPDQAQHAFGVGSEGANAAIGQADEQFGRLLSWLEESGRADETDVMVVSDHGHSTNIGAIEVETMVREAGFPPGDSPGGVVVAPNGGSVLFYVHDRDRATADKLACLAHGAAVVRRDDGLRRCGERPWHAPSSAAWRRWRTRPRAASLVRVGLDAEPGWTDGTRSLGGRSSRPRHARIDEPARDA